MKERYKIGNYSVLEEDFLLSSLPRFIVVNEEKKEMERFRLLSDAKVYANGLDMWSDR